MTMPHGPGWGGVRGRARLEGHTAAPQRAFPYFLQTPK